MHGGVDGRASSLLDPLNGITGSMYAITRRMR
jgi:hypothetical protein